MFIEICSLLGILITYELDNQIYGLETPSFVISKMEEATVLWQLV